MLLPPKHFKLQLHQSHIKVQSEHGQTLCPSVLLFLRLWFGLLMVYFHISKTCLILLSFSVSVFNLCFSQGDGVCVSKSYEESEGEGGGKRVASTLLVLSTVASTKVWPLVAIYGTQTCYVCACTQTFVFSSFLRFFHARSLCLSWSLWSLFQSFYSFNSLSFTVTLNS